MQPVAISTRWAKDVTLSVALPEYPRPQMVRENNWQNLNGLWSYAITAKDARRPDAFEGGILVPYPLESALSGVMKPLLPDQNLWYERSFMKPNLKSGERVLIHFGAVDWQAMIYINGKEIGSHTGGYTAFSFDITDALCNGSNSLAVKVFDPTDQGIGPHGKQVLNPSSIYYTASSGVWQTVWLETVPGTYIESLKLTPNVDSAMLSVSVQIAGNSNLMNKTEYSVEIMASSNGERINIGNYKLSPEMRLYIPNAHLWFPNDPFLYDLSVRLMHGNKVIDEVRSYFGMRKISIEKDDTGIDRIFLNNKYTYNLGILDQGYWPDGLYTAPTDEALQFDIKSIKAMGFNTIRKHIKVEPARWYYHADKIGILVWQDLINPNQGLPEGSKLEFETESVEILNQLHNFTSIITWVLFNEKWGQYDQSRLTKWIKQTDPSRLVNGHSGEYLYINNTLSSPSTNNYTNSDMTDVHSYPYPRISMKHNSKAQVCGEFGGIGVPVDGHLWDDLASGWGYDGVVTPKKLAQKYEQMIDSLKVWETQGLSGSIYTQAFDVESEQNGLLTYDRLIIKLPLQTIRNINAKICPITLDFDNAAAQLNLAILNDTTRDYETRISIYRSGKIDSAFLRSLTILADQKKDSSMVIELSNKYFKSIKHPYSTSNLKFFSRFTRSKNAAFYFIVNQYDSIKNIPELGSTLISLAKALIVADIRLKVLKNDKTLNLERLKKNLVKSYGKLGLLVSLEESALSCYINKNVTKFVTLKEEILDKYPNAIDSYTLNSDAWFVFQNGTEIKDLKKAAEWSERILKQQPNNSYIIDTYANILYKMGNKKDALIWQHKAYKLNEENKGIKENYERMKNGQPTWK